MNQLLRARARGCPALRAASGKYTTKGVHIGEHALVQRINRHVSTHIKTASANLPAANKGANQTKAQATQCRLVALHLQARPNESQPQGARRSPAQARGHRAGAQVL